MSQLEGRIALVTGAAHGLGAATARVLGQAGATVVVTDIDEDAGEQVAEDIRTGGSPAEFMKLDVANESNWTTVMALVTASHAGLDILVNNAGIVVVGPIEKTAVEDLERITRINLHGVYLGLKHGVVAMKERARASKAGGSIINFSSAVGIKGAPFFTSYSMTKGGIRLLTKCAALEFAALEYNIRVNSIHPGLVATDLFQQETAALTDMGILGDGDLAVTQKFFQDMAPVKRFGQPVEIANAVLFLASDESSFMTGSELVVDGGDTAS